MEKTSSGLCTWEDVVYGKINRALSALFYEVKIQKVSTVGNAV